MEDAIMMGQRVSATAIAQLSEKVLEQYRMQFKCPGCKAVAYFNKGWAKQAPHFASKNHEEDCEEARYGANSSDDRLVDAGTLVIKIDAIGQSSDECQDVGDRRQSIRRVLDPGTCGTADTAVIRGVRAVLRQLIENTALATSEKTIIAGGVSVLASDFFVPFSELNSLHAGRRVGVWGKIFSAREGGSITWLNRGDQKVTIEVPNLIFEELKSRYKFTSATELSGAMFLLLAEFDIHLTCRVKNLSRIALDIPRKL